MSPGATPRTRSLARAKASREGSDTPFPSLSLSLLCVSLQFFGIYLQLGVWVTVLSFAGYSGVKGVLEKTKAAEDVGKTRNASSRTSHPTHDRNSPHPSLPSLPSSPVRSHND